MKTTIIVPTYNEEKVIASTIDELQVFMLLLEKYKINILIFDSHSSDNTVLEIKKLQARYGNIILLQEGKKSGLGSAYIQAMQYAMDELKSDIVFEYDADGSHQPKYIPLMLAQLEHCDCVVGSRYVPGGAVDEGWCFYRKFLSRGASWLSQIFLSRKFKDYTSGFRATKTQALKKINLKNLFSKQYAYKIHLFWELYKTGARIEEFPIEFVDRKQGKSKLPRFNILESIWVLLKLRYREMKRFIKMCVCGTCGMAVQFVLFNLLRLHFHETISVPISIEAAIVTNFFVHNTISFREYKISKQQKLSYWLNQFGKFNLLSLLSMLIQTLIMHAGITVFGSSFVVANVLLIMGMMVGSITNYFSYKAYVWKVE